MNIYDSYYDYDINTIFNVNVINVVNFHYDVYFYD